MIKTQIKRWEIENGTNLANGTVTSHDTLKEIGDVSKRKEKNGRGEKEKRGYLQRLNSSLRHCVERSSSRFDDNSVVNPECLATTVWYDIWCGGGVGWNREATSRWRTDRTRGFALDI